MRQSARARLASWTMALVLLGLGAGCSSAGDVGRGPRASLVAYADALAEGRADDAYRLLSGDAQRSVSLEAFRRMVKENPEEVADIARALRRQGSDPVVTATVLSPDGEEMTLIYEDGRWRIDGTGIDRYGQATPRQAIDGFLRAFERQRYDVIMRYVPDKELVAPVAGAWGTATPQPSGDAKPAGVKDAGDGKDAGSGGGAASAAPSGSAAAEPPSEASPTTGLTASKLKRAWQGDQKEYIARIVQAIKAALPTARIEETEDRAAMPYGAGGTVLFVREQGLWKIEDLK